MCIAVWRLLDNIAQSFFLRNVGPWLTDNFYEENNLYNVVSTILGQHCIGILSSQCCPDTSKTTLHKEITYAILALSTDAAADMFPQENNLCNVVLICLSQHYTRKLLVQCWSTVHRQLCTEK